MTAFWIGNSDLKPEIGEEGIVTLTWEGDNWAARLIGVWVIDQNLMWTLLFLAEIDGIPYFLGNLKGGMGQNILQPNKHNESRGCHGWCKKYCLSTP
jgi:hypothetical protein